MRYSDGTVYIGDFYFGNRHGNGRLVDLNGELVYEGSWKNDVMHGSGKILIDGVLKQAVYSRGIIKSVS